MGSGPCETILTVPLIPGETQSDEVSKLEDVHLSYTSSQYEEGSTSMFKTCFNGLNALSGVGILSIPYALASGGWLSLILLLIIALAAYYSGVLIKKCMDANPDIKTYPDIGYYAFGDKGRIVLSVFMNLELYMVATGFLILEGDNMNSLFSSPGFKFLGLQFSGQQSFLLIAALIILPTVWVENLSFLSYVSATGVLASIVILGSVICAAIFDGIGFNFEGTELIRWEGIPNAVSLFAFCYCAHPVFPTLYMSMKQKSQFSTVLFFCFTLCTITYASMAVVGYLMFGSNVQSQITLNLPARKLSSKFAIYTTLVNPISKYALMVTPIINAMRRRFAFHGNKRFTSLIISTTFLISTVIVALAVPFFGALMSLVGAFLSITASVVFPSVCYLKISGTYQRLECELMVLSLTIFMGMLVIIFGTYTSIIDLFGQF